MARCLVTGGAGFIGSHLVRALLDQGQEVRVADNLFGPGSAERFNALIEDYPGKFEAMQADLTVQETVWRALEGVDTVFHQAALSSIPESIHNPRQSFRQNVQATMGLLWACSHRKSVKRFVFASSAAVYGLGLRLAYKEHSAGRSAVTSPYAADKLACERYVELFSDLYGLNAVSLRYFNVYGPGQLPGSALIPTAIQKALRDEPVGVFGDGLQTRDYIHVRDVVRANIMVGLDRPFLNGEFNVGTGYGLSVNFFLDVLSEHLGKKVGVLRKPERPGDVRDSRADIAAILMYGWQPMISFKDGIKETIEAQAALV